MCSNDEDTESDCRSTIGLEAIVFDLQHRFGGVVFTAAVIPSMIVLSTSGCEGLNQGRPSALAKGRGESEGLDSGHPTQDHGMCPFLKERNLSKTEGTSSMLHLKRISSPVVEIVSFLVAVLDGVILLWLAQSQLPAHRTTRSDV